MSYPPLFCRSPVSSTSYAFMNSPPSSSKSPTRLLFTFHFSPYLQEAMESFHRTLSPYELLFRALSSIPISHYFLAFLFCALIFLYNFLEFHFLEDVFSGFRGRPVSVTFNSRSQIYEGVVSKCRILQGR